MRLTIDYYLQMVDWFCPVDTINNLVFDIALISFRSSYCPCRDPHILVKNITMRKITLNCRPHNVNNKWMRHITQKIREYFDFKHKDNYNYGGTYTTPASSVGNSKNTSTNKSTTI